MATRQDVAKLAGVSPSTVSRVINENGYVAEDVRKRVKQAIQELNYIPNRVARSLRMQKCRQIACITPSISNSFYHEIVMGIEEIALENGYTFSLYNLTYEKREYLKLILEGFHDGVILLQPSEVEKILPLEQIAKHLPISMYCDRREVAAIPHVYVNLRRAMRKNVSHLIRLGHRDIIFLGYEFHAPEENPRFQGYVDAMNEFGLPILPHHQQFIPDLKDTLTVGYQKMIEFLERGMTCTAVVASNDLLAVGAMRAFTERGMRVPDDVSITGVDDSEISRLITPSLSTIGIPKQEIGNLLMRQLLDQINGMQTVYPAIEVSTELIMRESVMKKKIKIE
ncbi:LacI family transcriptional regulator [Fodinisporobacter ferrooxydans]|uniref:LacI family transcriptional regulator n=1 Tax=Fodinisporobacter ferrooxydans TaxID=2901836 RepID=A0ABY4CH36_9BACL|nr:LacI family transcriptional regulator [Alicyclobacillaceae bacterium MYW30-H2]